MKDIFKLFWTFVVLSIAEAAMIGDQCDWTGSGLTSTTERGVTPVYLRCREGSVTWVYPRGALRLLFRPSLPGDEKDFTVCIRVIRRSDPPDLFRESRENELETPERFPARIFVEGTKKLLPLYAPNDGDPRERRCFRSRKGRAALYVEAEPEEGPKRRVALFKYEARPRQRRHPDPAMADCRPCSDSELELAFCTSDFVSRGIFISTDSREDLDTTQLTLRLTKLIRATGSEDVVEKPDLDSGDYYRYDTDNALQSHRTYSGRKAHTHTHAHIQVSSVCGATGGAGEFLVMARRSLGVYTLLCAPRASDWKELVEKRNADGTAHCVLQH